MAYAAIQKHPRFRVTLPVDIVRESGEVEQRAIEDISLGGLFIRTPAPVPPGSFVRMHLALAQTAPAVPLMGRVVHVIDDAASVQKRREPGMRSASGESPSNCTPMPGSRPTPSAC